MIAISYRCPSCKRYSDEMKLLETRHESNTIEMELLQCKCGRILKWNEMEPITIYLKGELL